jgi:hypothetical protein
MNNNLLCIYTQILTFGHKTSVEISGKKTIKMADEKVV